MARTTTRALILTGLLSLFCSLPSRANTLDAPAVVEADGTGAFSYEAVFTASEFVVIGSTSVYGPPENNVDVGVIIGDCFCPPQGGCFVDPLEEFVIHVAGSLLDPLQNGSVTVGVILCGGPSFQTTTMITFTLPPVPILSEWGMVVLTLLLLVGGSIILGRRSVLAGVSSARSTTDANASSVN